MKKDRFIEQLNKGKIDVETAFEYFVSKGGKADYQGFMKILPHFSEDVVTRLLIHFEITVLERDGKVLKYM